MKKHLLFLFLIIVFTTSAIAQITMPAPYSSGATINYIRTWDAMAPITHPDTLQTRPYKDVKMSTVYVDGLGRPLQTVTRKGSMETNGFQYDMVSPVVYDVFGREAYSFLPFAANTTGSNSSLNDGLFKLNPFQQDSAFNKGIFSDETYYYNKNVYEASPLNRTIESFAPGNNWVGTASDGTEANRHGVKTKYWLNVIADSVRIWNVTDVSSNFGTYATSNIYGVGQLFKTVSQDEHNKQVIEFKDKDGQIVLKKVQLTADADTGIGKNYTGWLCTYYIYDDFGNLRCVVQPKGVELLAANSWSMSYSSNVVLNEQCFRYEYDSRNRMIMKKVPGVGKVYMVYDVRDRMVMMQDSSMGTSNRWMITKYDELNRTSETGLWVSATSFSSHQSSASASASYPTTSIYYEQLTKTFYDDYSWRSGESNPLSASRNSSYDGYFISPSNSTWPYPQDATTQSVQINGMVTGTKTKILETSSDFIYSVPFYDDKGRVTQTQSTNITTGTDIANVQYSWSGQSLLIINKIEKAGINAQTTVVVTKTSYDDLWRPIKTEKKIGTTKVNSGTIASTWTVENEMEYNALGQLKTKKLGADPLETLNYEYNIRGWTLGMNRNWVKDTTSTTNWFGYDLGYDKTGFIVNSNSQSYVAAQFNGNINGMLWRSTGDDMLRKYDFTYDAANRFLSADFNQLNSNSFSKAAGINFSVHGMSYDANGNILNMNQKGWKLGGSVTIDSLAYGYVSNSNRLNYVTDWKNETTTKLGDFKEVTNNTSQDYTYDANGNMTVDNNKAIDFIEYNHLNLPKTIYVTSGTIIYTYDAAGNKLRKEIIITPPIGPSRYNAHVYINGVVYDNEVLQYINTEEGRARIINDSIAIVYDYMIKDHLGNVRMVLTEEEKTDEYPVASMEPGNYTIENAFYSNLSTSQAKPERFEDNITDPNEYAALVQAHPSQNAVGPAISLKVMAGDKFTVRVSSYWTDGTPTSTPVNPLSSLVSNLNSIVGNLPGGHFTPTELSTNNAFATGAQSFLDGQSYNSSKPKAYVNWILFDEQFNYVSTNSGYEQVGDDGETTIHYFEDLPVNKNGYLFVYVSNADPELGVWFDNLQVKHIRGPLVSEEHYYPFGLTMKGISSQALGFGGSESKKKFQGQELAHNEFGENSGLDMYEFRWRMADPQTGRFWQADPLSEKYVYNSTYAFSENKVINGVELEGLEYVQANTASSNYIRNLTAPASEKRTHAEIQHLANDENTAKVKGIPALIIGAIAVSNPAVGIPLLVGAISGAPVSPSPQTISTTVGSAIAVEGTASNAESKMITLFRGVNSESPAYANATKGVAIPRGGTATAAEHNAGNTQSPFTSWTTDKAVAQNYAARTNGAGIVLETNVPVSSTVVSPNTKTVSLIQSPTTVVKEAEVLLRGRVNAMPSMYKLLKID